MDMEFTVVYLYFVMETEIFQSILFRCRTLLMPDIICTQFVSTLGIQRIKPEARPPEDGHADTRFDEFYTLDPQQFYKLKSGLKLLQ